jgi:hypothetical protein
LPAETLAIERRIFAEELAPLPAAVQEIMNVTPMTRYNEQ